MPGRPFTVEPGQVQILTVRYNPDDNPFTNGGTAHDNAVLMVSSSVGDKTVELEGSGLVNLRRRFEIRLNPNTNRLR